jgi:hypothetical protein
VIHTKLKAILLMLIVSLSLTAPLMVLPSVKAYSAGSEALWIENWLESDILHVNEFYTNGSFWRTLDFQFWNAPTDWRPKQLAWNYENGWDQVQKYNGKWFNNSGAANTTIAGYSMTVGVNENDNSNDAHDNIILTIGDNVWTQNGVHHLTFIDAIFACGSYRKQVVRTDLGKNETIFDYPNGFTANNTFYNGHLLDCPTLGSMASFWDEAFPEYNMPYSYYGNPGRSNDTGYLSNETYQDIPNVHGTAMRLGIDVSHPSSNGWVYDYSCYRFQVNNTNKWWFQVFDDNSFQTINNSTLTEQIYKLVVGFEDGWSQHDNFIDCVMCITGIWDYFKLSEPYHQWTQKLDFVYFTGGLGKTLEWESGQFGSGNWTIQIPNSQGAATYQYNVPLETDIYPVTPQISWGCLNLTTQAFSGWNVKEGLTYSAPTLTSDANRMCMAIRGTDDTIYYCYSYTGQVFASWHTLSGATPLTPAACLYNNQLHLVVVGEDWSSLWWGYVNMSTLAFSGWTLLSGYTPSAPTLTSNGTAMYLVVRGGDNGIWYRSYSGSDWSSWTEIPGNGATRDMPAATIINNQLDLEVIGMGGELWYGQLYLSNGTFSGWSQYPSTGATPCAPTLTSDSATKKFLVVRGLDDQVWYFDWSQSTWQNLSPVLTLLTPAACIFQGNLYIVAISVPST